MGLRFNQELMNAKKILKPNIHARLRKEIDEIRGRHGHNNQERPNTEGDISEPEGQAEHDNPVVQDGEAGTPGDNGGRVRKTRRTKRRKTRSNRAS